MKQTVCKGHSFSPQENFEKVHSCPEFKSGGF